MNPEYRGEVSDLLEVGVCSSVQVLHPLGTEDGYSGQWSWIQWTVDSGGW